jgi:hypothetical protein
MAGRGGVFLAVGRQLTLRRAPAIYGSLAAYAISIGIEVSIITGIAAPNRRNARRPDGFAVAQIKQCPAEPGHVATRADYHPPTHMLFDLLTHPPSVALGWRPMSAFRD